MSVMLVNNIVYDQKGCGYYYEKATCGMVGEGSDHSG